MPALLSITDVQQPTHPALLRWVLRREYPRIYAKPVGFAPMRDSTNGARYGPYWARTSDLRLVEPALSQLS
jgi:hypothetical protein